ncbi:unnamed protein product [Bursaphelenchus okinawaensis]|uniref:B9 domain-containing protein 2 n=1 Tax=Bursaphelenchus okinawaensis TaxID=465554 RepID=A0A811JTZ3_9BILA|nr:unnamed protein product [Bursaphelenchus okinawaensis]CAG9083785.1 unnamed protein product [Bursaphelenchus okinawaensis]
MAELHIIGQIESAEGFVDNRLSCRWIVYLGGGWRLIEGETEGQTQTDISVLEKAYFCHPIDLHLATRTIQNWPRIHLEVWRQDEFNRQQICGYGTVIIPSAPGEHEVICHCWRPKSGFRNELTSRFVGGGTQLKSLRILDDANERMRLQTASCGIVSLRLSVITRHFDRFGIQC